MGHNKANMKKSIFSSYRYITTDGDDSSFGGMLLDVVAVYNRGVGGVDEQYVRVNYHRSVPCIREQESERSQGERYLFTGRVGSVVRWSSRDFFGGIFPPLYFLLVMTVVMTYPVSDRIG